MRRLACLLALLSLCACSGPKPVPPPPAPVVMLPGEDIDSTDAYVAQYRALLGTSKAYTIGVGDVLTLGILDIEEEGKLLELEIEVGENGRIAVPVLGSIQAIDQTPSSLRATIVTELATRFLQDPYVVLKVKDFRSRRIAVLGGVTNPGIHYLPHEAVSVNEAISLAGGLAGGSLRAVVVTGGELPSQREIDLDALARGDVTQNATLRHGDVLHVLPMEQFTVAGLVNTPGQYEFRHSMTVRRAVALAGGVINPDCSLDMTRIRRRGPEGEYFVNVDLGGIIDDELADIRIQAGDILELRQSDFRYLGIGIYRVVVDLANIGFNAARLF